MGNKTLEDLFLKFTDDEPNDEPVCDMCSCEVCGGTFKVKDCPTEWDSEGWEYPSYLIHICPVCEDGGCISDYWPSDEALDK